MSCTHNDQLTSQALSAALRRVAQGDRQAFEIVYRTTSAKLMGICLRVLNDHGEAENVLHDVYMTVWLRAGSFSGERGTPIAWLASVARNRAIDRRRTLKPTGGSDVLETLDPEDDSPSALDRLSVASEYEDLHHCLSQLKEPCPSAILTAFFEGVTYVELARRAGVPDGTMKSWVRRGLQTLRAELSASDEHVGRAVTTSTVAPVR